MAIAGGKQFSVLENSLEQYLLGSRVRKVYPQPEQLNRVGMLFFRLYYCLEQKPHPSRLESCHLLQLVEVKLIVDVEQDICTLVGVLDVVTFC